MFIQSLDLKDELASCQDDQMQSTQTPHLCLAGAGIYSYRASAHTGRLELVDILKAADP